MAHRSDFCLLFLLSFCLAAAAAGSAEARQIDPASGIDFVTVRSPGNAPWPGTGLPGEDIAIGRGAVNYEYRIGRTEVTTAQWVEFYNAAFDRPGGERFPHLVPPTFCGAAGAAPQKVGGLRWRVPAGRENVPVGDISWRMAAIYCNWLHNGKGSDRAAFLSGAYDVSTFGTDGVAFTDQAARSPGARYFIPTWDEWLKAAHYDPNKPERDGWWIYPNASDTPLVQGVPGVGQTSAALNNPFILLGSYPGVQSPWGLLDVSGGTSEWTETLVTSTDGLKFRYYSGSA